MGVSFPFFKWTRPILVVIWTITSTTAQFQIFGLELNVKKKRAFLLLLFVIDKKKRVNFGLYGKFLNIRKYSYTMA